MYLGFDLGTSGLRAIVMDPSGAVVDSADCAYASQHPHPGWSEQDPADWIAACEMVMTELNSRQPAAMAAVRGMGISGQMHGATLLDAASQVLRPCILWNDTRSHVEAAALDRDPVMRDVSGNIVFPGFTAPKLAWVAKAEPDIFRKTAKVLLPKDYLRFWLTGEFLSDLSDSAGTGWLNVGKRDWSQAALELSGMRRDQMPDLTEGSAPAGVLRRDLARRWGISAAVTVAGGAGDNAAAACGAGCLTEGRGLISLGTSGVLLCAKESYAPNPEAAVHTFCHAVPDRWYQMGVILAATDSLNWLARITGQTVSDLDAKLPKYPTGPSDLTFLPYLSGERTPHNDAKIRGSFVGLDVGHGPAEMTQAVMEGVSFALRDCQMALESTGTQLTRLLALGGGARSVFWLRTLASVLNVQLDCPVQGENGAALGAARLAMVADTGADPSSVMTAPAIGQTIDPDPALADQYTAAYETFRALYPALRSIPN